MKSVQCVRNNFKLVELLFVGTCFGKYPGPSGSKDTGPLKNYIGWLVDWLGSPQLYWADYKPICAQKHGPYNKYKLIHANIYIYSKING